MAVWHETWQAKLVLRLIGVVLIAMAWGIGHHLCRIVAEQAGRDDGVIALLFAMLLFATASFGAALLVFGAGLWKPVQLSARWIATDPAPAPRMSIQPVAKTQRE